MVASLYKVIDKVHLKLHGGGKRGDLIFTKSLWKRQTLDTVPIMNEWIKNLDI